MFGCYLPDEAMDCSYEGINKPTWKKSSLLSTPYQVVIEAVEMPDLQLCKDEIIVSMKVITEKSETAAAAHLNPLTAK